MIIDCRKKADKLQMDSFLVYSIYCWLVLSTDGINVTLEMNSILPLKGSSLELSCRLSESFNNEAIIIWKGSAEVTTCVTGSSYLCEFYKTGYSFTANMTGVFGSISSLTTEAEGTWRCSYKRASGEYISSNSWILIVYTIPSGLSVTQNPNQNIDLSVQSVVLQCKTTGCTYPIPTVQWIFQDQTTSSEIVYITSNTTGTQETCAAQEKVYTSTLNIPQYTTLNDNSDKNVTFSCRIQYPDPSRNIKTSASHTVRFAVRVTEAYLQQNNQNITSTLDVIMGEQVTLTCVTGISRPAPIIGWYIGSRSMGSGTSLTFTPSNTDHNGTIYCQAYNTDPNIKVDSNKPRLFVRVTPEKPFSFHPTNVQEKQLSLRWQAGYNAGYTQAFIVEISVDNITWNNVSQVSAGNGDGWFTTVIEDLIPGSEYYFRLYAYNINGRGDLADVQLAIRTLKDVSASAGISVGGAVGAGVGGAVGGIVLGFIGAIIAFTFRSQLNGSKCSCFRRQGKTDDTMHTYSNTEMNPQTVKPIYEELNKGNTEPSVYDRISTL